MKKFLLAIFMAIGIFATAVGPIYLDGTLQTEVAHAQEDDGSTKNCGSAIDNTGKSCNLAERIADQNGFVFTSWKVMRGTVNILLIIALLLVSFSNIVRIDIDSYTVKKALPNLLIGVVLANASLFVIRYLADIATVATQFFVEQASVGGASFEKFISFTISLIGISTTTSVGAGIQSLGLVLGIILLIVSLVGILWLALILYIRLLAIYLLTILSPLAFVAYGIPGMDRYFKQWWQQFIKWLFILPAMSAVFWLMIVIGTDTVERDGAITRTITSNPSIGLTILLYALFFFALTIPSKLGGTIVNNATAAFRKYSGADASTNAIRESAKLRGQALMAKSPLGRLQASSERRKDHLENSIKLAKAKHAAGVRGRTVKFGKNRGKIRSSFAGRKEARLTESLLEAENNLSAIKSAGNKDFLETKEGKKALDRLKISELKKTSSEKRLEELKKLHALDFYKKADLKDEDVEAKDKKLVGEIKRVLGEFGDAVADEEIISGEVGRQEGIIKGNNMNRLYQVPQILTNYKDLRERYDEIEDKNSEEALNIKEQINSVTKSYENMKTKDGYGSIGKTDISKVDIATAAQLVGYVDKSLGEDKQKSFVNANKEAAGLAAGQQRQALKSFNAGVIGQIKDEIKEQTVPQIKRELQKYIDGDLGELAKEAGIDHSELKKAFFEGDTAKLSSLGMKDYKIRDGLVIAEKFKTIMKSTNDVRHSDILQGWMEATNDGVGAEIYTPDQINTARDGSQKDKRNLSAEVMSIGTTASSPANRQQKGADLMKPKQLSPAIPNTSATGAPSPQNPTPPTDNTSAPSSSSSNSGARAGTSGSTPTPEQLQEIYGGSSTSDQTPNSQDRDEEEVEDDEGNDEEEGEDNN